MLRYSWNASSACNVSAEMPGCTPSGLNPTRCEPSAAARSPFASTSTARTRLPSRAASNASAAATVVFPVPPLPETKMTRRRSSLSRIPEAETPACLRAGDSLEHLGRVTRRLHLAPLALDRPVGPDEKGAPLHAHVRAPHVRLLFPYIESVDEHTVGIADQRDPERAPGDELLVAALRIRRHAEDVDALGLEVGAEAGELLPLDGAARRVVLRIEVQHRAPPLEIAGAQAATAARGQIETRNRITGCHRFDSSAICPADRQRRSLGPAAWLPILAAHARLPATRHRRRTGQPRPHPAALHLLRSARRGS